MRSVHEIRNILLDTKYEVLLLIPIHFCRFPFLDEDVVSALNAVPVWHKLLPSLPRGLGEKLLLRVLCASKGLSSAAALPKRAIQFGSRIAKMENTREKGGDVCARLKS